MRACVRETNFIKFKGVGFTQIKLYVGYSDSRRREKKHVMARNATVASLTPGVRVVWARPSMERAGMESRRGCDQ